MKFIISSSDFLKSIQSLIGIVINNPALPIIENVLLEISPNNLNIKATDLETTIITRITIESKSTQSLAINAKLLLDTLKAFPEQPLTFKTNDTNHTIEIISEQGNYSLAYIDGEEFPNTPYKIQKYCSVLHNTQILSFGYVSEAQLNKQKYPYNENQHQYLQTVFQSHRMRTEERLGG